MQKLLPIIIICCVGLAVCVGILAYFFVRYLILRFKRKKEIFDMDDSTLTIVLDKNTHKRK